MSEPTTYGKIYMLRPVLLWRIPIGLLRDKYVFSFCLYAIEEFLFTVSAYTIAAAVS